MKHFLICNPTAGHEDCTPQLRSAAAKVLPEAEILMTEGPGHATRLVEEYAARYAEETCRFYACGGDGTLLEVAEGVIRHPNAQVACIPCGTGNDFVRIFSPTERMKDLKAQSQGTVVELNMLQCNDRLALNIASGGIDARAAAWVVKNKRYVPFGGLAYKVGLLVTFFRKLDRHFTLQVDGQVIEDDLSIVLAANGRYYGGGFYAMPEAEPDDDTLDLMYIRKVNRLTMLKCLPKYASGHHNQLPETLHKVRQAREIRIHTEKPEPITVDGEILMTTDAVIRIADQKLRFVVPQGAELVHNAAKLLDKPKSRTARA